MQPNNSHLVIHYHFVIADMLLRYPARCTRLILESIPFFQLYPAIDLTRIRQVIDALSAEPMPHHLQKIAGKLTPPPHLADNYYRQELISMTYCVLNKQGFFVRAYRLRSSSFIKVEMVLHSATLGKGKYLTFEKAHRGAQRLFAQLDRVAAPILPLTRHRDDFFFTAYFDKEVRVIENELNDLKSCANALTKGSLKGKLIARLQDFQVNSMDIAKQQLEDLRLSEVVHAHYIDLLSPEKE